MDVLIKKAIVTQNQTIHKGENSFQAVKITAVLEDGSTQDYTMAGQREDFLNIVCWKNASLNCRWAAI